MSNMLFLIELQDNHISVSEYNSDTKGFTTLKNKGETWQVFDKLEFWKWFKKKIAYQDEELSFIVNSDNKDFCIDKTIKVSKNIDVTKDFINQIDFKGKLSDIYTIPKVKDLNIKKIQKEKPPIRKKNYIVEYMISKIESYKER